MRVKKYVSNSVKQTVVKGFNIERDGQHEAEFVLKGVVKDIDKAVKKIRANGNNNFVSFTEPKIETVTAVVPIEIFNAIALNENEINELDKIAYANQAIIAIQNWITENAGDNNTK